jgi:hypothetical protein
MSDNLFSFLSLSGKDLQGCNGNFWYYASHFLFTVVSPLLTVQRTNGIGFTRRAAVGKSLRYKTHCKQKPPICTGDSPVGCKPWLGGGLAEKGLLWYIYLGYIYTY